MRKQKSVLVVGILLLIGFFITGAANAAPDMSKWEGTWFSFQMTKKGVIFDGFKFMNVTEKSAGYFKIQSWDQQEAQFVINVYSNNNGAWQSTTRYIHFHAGNDLSFLFWYRDEGTQFGGQIQGKEKGGILSSATIKTLGGLALGNDDNEYGVGSATLTAKMVTESKVPSAVLGGSGGGRGTGAGNFTVPRATITFMKPELGEYRTLFLLP